MTKNQIQEKIRILKKERDKLHDEMTRAGTRQLTVKILINSIYG